MRISPLIAVVTLAVLTLAPSDCSGTNPQTKGSPSAPASPSASPSLSGASHSIAAIPTNTKCAVVGNLDGVFKASSQMDDYLACIVPEIEQWIDVVRPNAPHPHAYYFIPAGVTGREGGCRYDEGTLAYCPLSQNVYFGELSTWQQYTKHGDAAAAVIMAHEVTHHFQRLVNMPRATVAAEQIKYEDQADCGAGTFIAYATRQGWVRLKDDVIDVPVTLAAAGSAPGPTRDHGTSTERLASFGRGLLGHGASPLAICNHFVPGYSLTG